MRTPKWLAAVLTMGLLMSSGASAAGRVALLIGNANYGNHPALKNPANDADLLARVLKLELGFRDEEVQVIKDRGKRDLEIAIRRFVRQSAGAEVAFLYFSGHGMQPSTGGKSFLLGVDAVADSDEALEADGVSVEGLVEELERMPRPAALRVVVLDACRNSPFGRNVKGDVKGLAPVRPTDQYTLVGYATRAGDVAQDGSGVNSPYATSLAKWLGRAKEMPLRIIFENTAEDVKRATGHAQKPGTYGDLPSNVLLSGGVASLDAGAAPAPVTESPASPRVFRDCAECPELVEIPSGPFDMGSQEAGEADLWEGEGPLHRVEIGRFALGRFEVTKGEYRRFTQETGHPTGACQEWNGAAWEDTDRTWEAPGYYQRDDHPAVCVSWEDAQRYAEWLNEKTGGSYRLASEAEWEYAARAGVTGMTYWDGEPDQACQHANAWDLVAQKKFPEAEAYFECEDDHAETARVGRFQPNAFGLKDMLGNVKEWVQDCWNETYVGAPGDGSAWETGDCEWRMVRGGSWMTNPLGVRLAHRGSEAVSVRRHDTGFRLARDLP